METDMGDFGLKPAAKAWIALVLGVVMAGLVALEAAMGDGVVQPVEWVQIAVAMVGVPAFVWAIPNRTT